MQMQFKQIFPAFLYDIFCVFGPMPLAIHFSSLSSTVRFDNFIHRRVQFNLNMGTWKCKESCERRKKNRAMVRQTRFFRWKSSKRYIERMKVNFCCSHGFLNERKFWIEFEYAMHVNQNLNNPKWWQKNLEKNEWNTEKKLVRFAYDGAFPLFDLYTQLKELGIFMQCSNDKKFKRNREGMERMAMWGDKTRKGWRSE